VEPRLTGMRLAERSRCGATSIPPRECVWGACEPRTTRLGRGRQLSRTDKRMYYRFRILRHDVAELTVFLGDPQGLAEPGLTHVVKEDYT
jgi:hypothetical protein